MDFSLNAEQREIQALARDFTRKEVAPVQLRMDQDHEFPYALWEQWSDLGMAGILIPEEYGGSGLDALTYILALEEVATESNTFALIWQVHVLVAEMYRKFASAEQKQHWLPPFARGEKLGAIGLTEAGAIEITAQRDNPLYFGGLAGRRDNNVVARLNYAANDGA